MTYAVALLAGLVAGFTGCLSLVLAIGWLSLRREREVTDRMFKVCSKLAAEVAASYSVNVEEAQEAILRAAGRKLTVVRDDD